MNGTLTVGGFVLVSFNGVVNSKTRTPYVQLLPSTFQSYHNKALVKDLVEVHIICSRKQQWSTIAGHASIYALLVKIIKALSN